MGDFGINIKNERFNYDRYKISFDARVFYFSMQAWLNLDLLIKL